MTRKIGIILIILLINLSCIKEKPFEIPEGETELTLFAENYPENSMKVRVSLAQTIGHYPYYQLNEPIKVSLFENNNLLQENIYYGVAYFNKTMLREGNKYKVKVSNPRYDDIEAETIKPVPVKINSVTWKHIKGKMPEWYFDVYGSYEVQAPMGPTIEYTHMIEFSITFDDPQENNFYQCGIHIFNNVAECKMKYASFGWPDPLYNNVSYITPLPNYPNPTRTGIANEIVFDDKDFNGKEKTVRLVIPAREDVTTSSYIVKLYSLSEDHYKYIVSKWLYNRSKDDPFAEPVDFHSNVSNGIGIFSIASCDYDTIIVKN